MRTFALCLVAAVLALPFAGSASAAAAKKKPAVKTVSAPAASAAEIEKL